MSDPVEKLDFIRGVGRRGAGGASFKHEKKVKHGHDEEEDDCVDISEEARERASGKKKKSILEYIGE
jgi:hypothetical protein